MINIDLQKILPHKSPEKGLMMRNRSMKRCTLEQRIIFKKNCVENKEESAEMPEQGNINLYGFYANSGVGK